MNSNCFTLGFTTFHVRLHKCTADVFFLPQFATLPFISKRFPFLALLIRKIKRSSIFLMLKLRNQFEDFTQPPFSTGNPSSVFFLLLFHRDYQLGQQRAFRTVQLLSLHYWYFLPCKSLAKISNKSVQQYLHVFFRISNKSKAIKWQLCIIINKKPMQNVVKCQSP